MVTTALSLMAFCATICYGIYRANKVPACLSDFYYHIGYLFTGGMVITAMLMIPEMLEITPERWQILAFMCCSGVCFVGVAADYRCAFTYPAHYVSANISAICSICWVLCVQPVALFFLLFGLIGLVDRSRWLLYCELACFAMVYITMIIK